MLRFNPQAEVHHDQINKDIIREASDALKKYLTYKYLNLTDVRFLCPINFVKGKSDNETNQYYQELQKEWVSFFECLNLVEYEDGKTIPVKSIRVLSNELYLACEQDVSLLDAIYNLLSKAVHLILPKKEELLFWSKVINEWYVDNEAENLHIISIDSLVSLIQETTITESDLDWLHKLCYYFRFSTV